MADRKTDSDRSYAFRKFVDWVFRRKHPEVLIILAIIPFLTVAVAGLASEFELLTDRFDLFVEMGDLETIGTVAVVAMLIAIAVCMWILCRRFSAEQARLSERRLIIIEGRGLRDDDGTPLADLGRSIDPAQQIYRRLDLRQKVNETIIEPAALLPKIAAMRDTLNQERASVGAKNVKVLYGGLTPVPFSVMTGIELDDEGAIEVVDWDRQAEGWRRLDGTDDGASFQVEGLEALGGARQILLTVSVSYPISEADLATTFDMPRVQMALLKPCGTAHWSKDKQARLSMEVFEVCKQLSGHGVERIHLVLAAPNSVSFNIGRRYDRRNLPKLYIYQYERTDDVRYPWSVWAGAPGLSSEIRQTDLSKEGFAGHVSDAELK